MSDTAHGQHRVRSTRAYVYDLSDAATIELTREFLSTKTIAPSERFVCFEVEGRDRFANIGRQIEREVFEETFGNDPVCMTNEYSPYEESSLFFLVVDAQECAPAGVTRMIRNSPAGLKTLVDMQDGSKTPTPVRIEDVMLQHGIDDLDSCWDGATSAVRRRYRWRLAAIHVKLLRAWFTAAHRENVKHLVSILDAPIYRAVREIYRVPVVPLAGTPPFTYMDAPNSQAIYGHIETSVARAVHGHRKLGAKLRDSMTGGSVPGSDLMLQTQPHAN
jgi:hypothetical protein